MRSSNFDVGIIDLCWGECAHAFAAVVLGLPIIAYWPHSAGDTNLGSVMSLELDLYLTFHLKVIKVSPVNLLEGFGVSTVFVPQLSIMNIVDFNEI